MNSSSTVDLIYQDDHLLVANKPAGLLSVPGRGADKQDCFSFRLQQEFPDALVVHRLDMSTSGLMLFARGIEMQRCLSQMFRERGVSKKYMAVVSGALQQDAGEIRLPLICDWPNRPRQMVNHAQGKPSHTCYRLLRPEGANSRVELEPVTGRTHQLRVHMAAIGHPVLGDALYGDESSAPRLLLHASSLGFNHPADGRQLCFSSAAPF